MKVDKQLAVYTPDEASYGSVRAFLCFRSVDEEKADVAAVAASATKTAMQPSDETAAITKSIKDNEGFVSSVAFKGLTVTLDSASGEVDVTVKPDLLNETDTLTKESAVALTASKAIWTTYPDVQSITVIVLSDFTDQYGKTTTGPAASTTVYRVTGLKFDYEGLRARVLADNKLFFCAADQYIIDPVIYVKVKDKGCLAGTSKG